MGMEKEKEEGMGEMGEGGRDGERRRKGEGGCQPAVKRETRFQGRGINQFNRLVLLGYVCASMQQQCNIVSTVLDCTHYLIYCSHLVI